MFKICYDTQTWFLKFTDQKKQLKKKLRNETDPS